MTRTRRCRHRRQPGEPRVTFSMSESAEQSRKIQRLDPLLVAALSLAFLFCLQGITWGRVEDWNRSSIAMRSLHALRPSDYMKPPFHTYLNHVLVVWPITGALKIAQVPRERMKIANPAKLIGSRLRFFSAALHSLIVLAAARTEDFLPLSSRLLWPRAPDLLLTRISSPSIYRSCFGCWRHFGPRIGSYQILAGGITSSLAF